MSRSRFTVLSALVLALSACDAGPGEPVVRPIDTPAPPGSVFPSLAVHGEQVLMSWAEPASDDREARVRFAAWSAGEWGAAETVGSGNLFVNWADFASLAVDAEGTIAAQWLVRGGGAAFAYGIRFAVRAADGSWGEPQIPHGRDRAAEHGFVSLLSRTAGEFELIWLDGRRMGSGGEMELRHAAWRDGHFETERVLDDDVCTCCQTDAVLLGEQSFVAYRDHAAGEIRDISFVRFDGNNWSGPTPLSSDGWRIGACPVNGPALAVNGESLSAAWFTQANDEPRVWLKRSADFGETFGDLIRIDEGDPLGRVDTMLLDDGSTIVAWLERSGDEAVVVARRVVADQPGPPLELGRTAAHRESGFPRLATDGSSVWAAWTETSRPTRIRLVRIDW